MHHKKNHISYRKVCRESGDVNEENTEHWIKEILPGVILGYDSRHIFNMDEIALFYALMPNNTVTIKDETHAGGCKFKDWLTTQLCCNVNGTEKLKPLITGEFVKLRCLKNISTFPSQYSSNLNGKNEVL